MTATAKLHWRQGCPGPLLVSAHEGRREALHQVWAQVPHQTEASVRRQLQEALDARAHLTQHGRGTLPRAIRLDEARQVLAEATRFVETNDFMGMHRLLAERRTPDRLGVKIDLREIAVDVGDLPSVDLSDAAFDEWFIDNYIAVAATLTNHSHYWPEADHAWKSDVEAFARQHQQPPPQFTEPLNTAIVPHVLFLALLPGTNGASERRSFPVELTAIGANATGRGPRLSQARLLLLARRLLLAQWEEIFHHVDWAVWTATGESLSPTFNKVLARLGLQYEWWAFNELAPAFYGRHETKALVGTDAVRKNFDGSYPELRHLVGQSAWVHRALEP